MFALIILKFPSYYYSTMLFLSVGMFFSLFKNKFDNIVMKNNILYLLLLIISTLGFIFFKKIVSKYEILYPLWCGFGMMAVLLLSMKIKIKNAVLLHIGELTFYIFTLQGIPQIIFSKINISNNYLYYFLVIVFTLLLAELAKFIINRLKKI